MEPNQLRAALEAMMLVGEESSQLSAVARMVVQLAQLDGPLRMMGGVPRYTELVSDLRIERAQFYGSLYRTTLSSTGPCAWWAACRVIRNYSQTYE